MESRTLGSFPLTTRALNTYPPSSIAAERCNLALLCCARRLYTNTTSHSPSTAR